MAPVMLNGRVPLDQELPAIEHGRQRVNGATNTFNTSQGPLT